MNNIKFNLIKNINNNFYTYYDNKLLIKKKFEIGDHIKYQYFKKNISKKYKKILPDLNLPNHHCVYIGNGKIINYTKNSEKIASLSDFIKSISNFKTDIENVDILKKIKKNHQVYIGKYPKVEKKEILKRVKKIKSYPKYGLFYNNCETLAIYCITGNRLYFQTELNNFLGNNIVKIINKSHKSPMMFFDLLRNINN